MLLSRRELFAVKLMRAGSVLVGKSMQGGARARSRPDGGEGKTEGH